jgi:glycosyltransferase involved in cell wall biosynthesis/Flp pilus assembly protein TadD
MYRILHRSNCQADDMTTIGLSMIVRNAEQNLERCLSSARDSVDEIVIADTGSKDSTVAIAQKFGARVVDTAWADDFALARNQALQSVTADWVLSLNADEMLDPHAYAPLRQSVERAAVAAYGLNVRTYLRNVEPYVWNLHSRPNDFAIEAADEFPAYIEHTSVRLFRRHPGVYFEGRVHETVGARIRTLNLTIANAEFAIHHFGMAADAEAQNRQNLYYRELGRQKLLEMPESSQAHFEMGMLELETFHEDSDALTCFMNACRLNDGASYEWFFAGVANLRMCQFKAAIGCFRLAEDAGYHTAATAELSGDAYYDMGNFESAQSSYRRAFGRANDSPDIRSKLGLAEVHAGMIQDGLAELHIAVDEDPCSRGPHERLIEAELWLGHFAEAARAAEFAIGRVVAEPEDFFRGASICSRLRSRSQCLNFLRAGVARFPGSAALRTALADAVSGFTWSETWHAH